MFQLGSPSRPGGPGSRTFEHRSPISFLQLCVILPRAAHVARINNILRNRNRCRYYATASELLIAYKEAYKLVGN
jgi:hypothetical protein